MTKETPHPVDLYVGQRLRARRKALGLKQQELGEKVGIAFQQIQKYETAGNRISASMLFEIATALDVPVTYFFGGLERKAPAGTTTEQDPNQVVNDFVNSADGMELASHYPKIPDPRQKQIVLDLVRSLAGDCDLPLRPKRTKQPR